MARQPDLITTEAKISEVIDTVPELVEELKEFDITTTISILSGLLTDPQFHPNTYRLEVLMYVAFLCTDGNKKPQKKDIHRWLNECLGSTWIASSEDPVEDVFLSNVITHRGNHRIFEGMWEANDFYLQEVVDVLDKTPDEDRFNKLRREVEALLILSETIAGRRKISRFCMSDGEPKGDIVIPDNSKLSDMAKNVAFSPDDLLGIGIETNDLTPFIFEDDERRKIADELIGNTRLEHQPLVRDGKNIIVALPTAISPAIRYHVLRRMAELDQLDTFTRVLRHKQVDSAFNNGLLTIEIEPGSFSLPPKPAGALPEFDQITCCFDEGRFAHVVILHDDLNAYLKDGIQSLSNYANEDGEKFSKYLTDCATSISERPNYSGGMTLLIHGGLGRGYLLLGQDFPENWAFVSYRLPDFLDLGWEENMSLLRIWKLCREQRLLEDKGVKILNINGDLNLYAFWKSQGFTLVHQDLPFGYGQPFLVISSDFIAGFRRFLRSGYDNHAAPRGKPEEWVKVSRRSASTLSGEIEDEPIYASIAALEENKLHGVVEKQDRSWWLFAEQDFEHEWHRDIMFRLWDALLNWLNKVASVLEEYTRMLPDGPIHIRLFLEGMEEWSEPNLEVVKENPHAPYVHIDKGSSTIDIKIPASFLKRFNIPENVAERELVLKIIEGVLKLANLQIDSDMTDLLVRNVISDKDARFVHILNARTFRDHFDLPSPRFISEEDVAFANLGLAWLLRTPCRGETLSGKGDCISFLHSLGDALWKRIETRLTEIDRTSLIKLCLLNYEAIEKDRDIWRYTARAVLAVHPNENEVMNAASKRRDKQSSSAVTSRVLVEMAVCACAKDGGREAGNLDLDTLLAEIETLIITAYYADAIYYGYGKPEIEISASGRISVDKSFFDAVVSPYNKDYFDASFKAAAADYDTLFDEGRGSDEPPKEAASGDFIIAFETEYRIIPQKLVDAIVAIELFAIKRKMPVIEMHTKQLANLLMSDCGLRQEQVDYLLSSLILYPRAGWNEDKPEGFRAKDWFPWRHQRRLSCLARPIIEVRNSKIIVSPGLLGRGCEYLINNAYRGDFPPEFFRSKKMHQWIGKTTHRRGLEFNDSVAQRFREFGINARPGIRMSELGVPHGGGNFRQSDVDVLAWDKSSGIVFVVECKRLRNARTIGEISEQLNRFKGGQRGEKKDDLAKHIERFNWLKEYPSGVSRITEIPENKITFISFLVTNRLVPMKFTEGLPIPTDNICSIPNLEETVKKFMTQTVQMKANHE